ncbi:MAG: hypothetical protein SFY66_19880 [Oculatellaceae cyanobacterium bins.114]|nr:hypothetical protein [Oculatellaceae cyanobacterium bins.114]
MGVQPESTPSTATYTSTIYQWETNDPVLGGSGGIANNPILGLCNRTQWLFNKVSSLVIGTDVQAYDADLAAIAALTGTGLLRRTGTNTWALVSPFSDNSIAQGRLTLSSGTAVTTTDQVGQTTLYYTPYGGNGISLWNGSEWVFYTFQERTLSLAGLAANTNHDIFVWDSGGGNLSLQAIAWTNGTTRATALSLRNGVWVKSGDDRRYLGTIRTTGSVGQCEDSEAKRFVWNARNRVPRKLFGFDGAVNYTYSGTSFRATNNNALCRIEIVVGLPGEEILYVQGGNGHSSGDGLVSIGVNSTTIASADLSGNSAQGNATNRNLTYFTHLYSPPSLGYSYYQLLEASETGAVTEFVTPRIAGAWRA